MGTVVFNCGCSIISSMFGEREIMGVSHCLEHSYLYSQNKTNKQMATEIHEIHDLLDKKQDGE